MVVQGKGGISAKIIADSVHGGKRITTYELEYPRFFHSEFLTHRMLSRNSASSRAIPVEKQIENILKQTAMPIHWGKNQPGMQADEECNTQIVDTSFGSEAYSREKWWTCARDSAIEYAKHFHKAGYHKQIVNRGLEVFVMMKTVCTATEYDNFFELRRHKDAQPELRELANCMRQAMQQNTPIELRAGEWHVPYYKDGYWKQDFEIQLGEETDMHHLDVPGGESLDDAIAVSASCCAQVSYRKNDTSIQKARDIFKRLVESKPIHASPFEHQATPFNNVNVQFPIGCTHIDQNGEKWSGNFQGWIQNRQLIEC